MQSFSKAYTLISLSWHFRNHRAT